MTEVTSVGSPVHKIERKFIDMTLRQKALIVVWVERVINLFVSALLSGLGQVVSQISMETKPLVIKSIVVEFIYNHPYTIGRFANALGMIGVWVTVVIWGIDIICRNKNKEIREECKKGEAR